MVKWATTHNSSIITSQWHTPQFSGSVDEEGEAVDIPSVPVMEPTLPPVLATEPTLQEAVDIPPVPVMEPTLPPVLATEPTLPPALAIGPGISSVPVMTPTTHDYAMAWMAYQDAVDLLSVPGMEPNTPIVPVMAPNIPAVPIVVSTGTIAKIEALKTEMDTTIAKLQELESDTDTDMDTDSNDDSSVATMGALIAKLKRVVNEEDEILSGMDLILDQQADMEDNDEDTIASL